MSNERIEALSVIFIKGDRAVSVQGPTPVRDIVAYLDEVFNSDIPDKTTVSSVTVGGIDREVVCVASGPVLVQLTKRVQSDGPDWATRVSEVIALALDASVSNRSMVSGKPLIRSE